VTEGQTPSLPPAPEPLPVAVADSHCHLDLQHGEHIEPAEAIARSREVGVDRIVQIGCDLEGARWTATCVQEHPEVVGAVALHPNEAPRLIAQGGNAFNDAFDEIAALAREPRIRAVGETGLDRFRTGPEGIAAQRESFARHIELARQVGKPLVIHDRDAHDDVLEVLDEVGAPADVVMHCFSGDAAFAIECVRRGFTLSFAGVVTFKNATALREALATVPLDHLLVETDAPYLTPAPHRGRTNASYLVPWTVRTMAEVLDTPVDDVCTAISATSNRLFGPW
jgi:TatD DNase family protein